MEALDIRTFSPKELAQVVGVSESSIKRWVDDARLHVTRTAGGHRRIPFHEALRFIRVQGLPILRPDLLGLPDVADVPAAARLGGLTAEMLFHLLRQGESAKARGLLLQHYLDGGALAELFDGPMAGALARLGEIWHHNEEEGIYVEHIATGVCVEAVNQLRLLLPPPSEDAPVALGGAPSGDPYFLPSLMAAAVLTEAGYASVNLGAHTPTSAFLQAVEAHDPALVWLSVTAPMSAGQADAFVSDLVRPLTAAGRAVLVGGQHVAALSLDGMTGVQVMTSMADLAAHAAERRGSRPG